MKKLLLQRLSDYTSRKFLAFIFVTILAFTLIKSGLIQTEIAQCVLLLGGLALYELFNFLDKFVGLKIKTGADGIDIEAIGEDVPHDPDAGDDDPEFPPEMPKKEVIETRKIGYRRK